MHYWLWSREVGEKSHFRGRSLLCSGNFWCANFPLGAAFYGVVGKHPRLLHWASPKSEAVQLGSVEQGARSICSSLPARGRWWCSKKWKGEPDTPKPLESGKQFFLNCPNMEVVEAGIDPKPTQTVHVSSSKYQDMWTDFFQFLAFYARIFRVAFLPVRQYPYPLKACSSLPDMCQRVCTSFLQGT